MTCAVPSCDRDEGRTAVPGVGKVCVGHYERWRRTGDVRADVPLRPRSPSQPKPSCADCGRPCSRITATRCPACIDRARRTLDALLAVPVGSLRLAGGLVWVKVAQPGLWLPRALYAWQAIHGRDLPGGHVLVHVDGNRLNDDPGNLRVVWRGGPRAVA